jgi:hypothetical protein
MRIAFVHGVAVLQALIAFLSRSAGKVLNAAFGWSVRALFGNTSGVEGSLLTVAVALAAFWPLLLLGAAAPRIATFALTFVPLPEWISEGAIRIAWLALAAAVPFVLGLALAAKQPEGVPRESALVRVLRGVPLTLGISIAFWITLVTVPLTRLAGIVRGWRDEHVPLITRREAYEQAAGRIQRVLNERGFELAPAPPAFWVRASMGALRSLGGPSMQRYVPERLAHLVGPKLQVTLHPSSLLLRGAEAATTIAHGLVVEALAPCDAFQAIDPKAQEIEREIRRIWQVLEENPRAHRHSPFLESRLRDVSEEIARLETSYDDWQTVYREALQLGRALEGEPPLLARVEGVDVNTKEEGERELVRSDPRVRHLATTELMGEITSKAVLLAKKEVELARRELRKDLESEIAMAKGFAVAAVAASVTINLLFVAAVFALTPFLEGWAAALCLAGGALVVAVVAALVARRWHVEKPLARTRKTLVEDLQWAKERMA